jgi:hypothetical protein
MILDAAETVLGYFGFDRAVYGDNKNTVRVRVIVSKQYSGCI